MTIPQLAPQSRLSDLATGLILPFRALKLIFTNSRLFLLSLACAVVTAGTIVALAIFGWPLAHEWAHSLLGEGASWRAVLSEILGFAFFLVLFVSGVLTLPNVVLAPLQDPLSEATEAHLGDFTPPAFTAAALVRGVVESLKHTGLRLFLSLLGFALLFPLNLIPVAGSVLWAALSSAWTMFWLSTEHLSGPMARHLYPFGQVVRCLRRRLPLAMGLGAALYVLLWVPVLNFFLMPVAVVAGTLLYRGLKSAGALDPAG